MNNIASYQEGFTDGYDEAKLKTKIHIIELLATFIEEQKEEDPVKPYLQGYNQALTDLKEYIEEYIK